MSQLRIFAEDAPGQALLDSSDLAEITAALGAAGVGFERWGTAADIHPGAAPEIVLAAYQTDIERLMTAQGYLTADVISLSADHPEKDTLRHKFLSEHTHGEDEVRFFVAGQGLFSLHLGQRVFEVLCTRGDLIQVPANTPHWFDMGPNPEFVAIRLFNNPEGWVAHFTGNDIASRFNRLDN